ncbi:MAG TPA: ATP-grasp domain-containing protein [Streptosporangiaceae bacterium]|nr:ATP-grasp domain-containing protein [Streptosporangiaceae bacterium]
MNTRQRLLLVGAGNMGRGYVLAARDMGIPVTLVESAARVAEYRDLVSEVVETTGPAEQHWIQSAVMAAGRCRPTAVLAFAEPHVLGAAWVQHALGLPGPSLVAATASRDKALQRVLLDRTSVPQPEFVIASDFATAQEFAAGRYPVVVKALRSTGSNGVTLVYDEAGLQACVGNEHLLVESFVDGPEYSVEALVRDGHVLFRNYTRKITSGPPEFVEVGHILPVTFEQPQVVDAMVAELVTGLGIMTGLVHAEFRVHDGRPYVMETAVRTPGDHIMELLSLAYGEDMFAQVIRVLTGREPKLPGTADGLAGIRYLQPGPGAVVRVDGIEQAAALPGVVRVQTASYQVGQVVRPLRSSRDRGGYAVLRAKDEAELTGRMRLFLDTVTVVTSGPGPTGPVTSPGPGSLSPHNPAVTSEISEMAVHRRRSMSGKPSRRGTD